VVFVKFVLLVFYDQVVRFVCSLFFVPGKFCIILSWRYEPQGYGPKEVFLFFLEFLCCEHLKYASSQNKIIHFVPVFFPVIRLKLVSTFF